MITETPKKKETQKKEIQKKKLQKPNTRDFQQQKMK
jgi:hypothetical protein